MLQPPRPQPLLAACHDAYYLALFAQCEEDFIEPFLTRWGGYSASLLEHVLQKGEDGEKIFALFLLGYTAFPQASQLLLPFVHSEKRMERWASSIAMGLLKDPQAFVLLRELLLEDIGDEFPRDEPLERAAQEAQNADSRKRAGNGDDEGLPSWRRWEHLLDPERVQAYYALYQRQREYEWCLYLRTRIVDILGAWEQVQIVATFQHVFRLAYEMEQRVSGLAPEWRRLQDCLAYALGRLGAWDALSPLDLSPARRHIATIYQILGSLEISDEKLYYASDVERLWRSPDSPEARLRQLRKQMTPEERANPLYQKMAEAWIPQSSFFHMLPKPFAPLDIDPEPVAQALGEHFGFSREEQMSYIHGFHLAYRERNRNRDE